MESRSTRRRPATRRFGEHCTVHALVGFCYSFVLLELYSSRFRQHLFAVRQESSRTIPSQHGYELFSLSMVRGNKAILMDISFDNPQICPARSHAIHLDLHLKLVTPEEGHGRERHPLAEDVSGHRLSLLGS